MKLSFNWFIFNSINSLTNISCDYACIWYWWVFHIINYASALSIFWQFSLELMKIWIFQAFQKHCNRMSSTDCVLIDIKILWKFIDIIFLDAFNSIHVKFLDLFCNSILIIVNFISQINKIKILTPVTKIWWNNNQILRIFF